MLDFTPLGDAGQNLLAKTDALRSKNKAKNEPLERVRAGLCIHLSVRCCEHVALVLEDSKIGQVAMFVWSSTHRCHTIEEWPALFIC